MVGGHDDDAVGRVDHSVEHIEQPRKVELVLNLVQLVVFAHRAHHAALRRALLDDDYLLLLHHLSLLHHLALLWHHERCGRADRRALGGAQQRRVRRAAPPRGQVLAVVRMRRASRHLGGDGGGGGLRLGRAPLDDFGGGVDVFHHEDHLLEGEGHGDLGVVVVLRLARVDAPEALVEHDVHQLLVGLDLRERHRDDVPLGVVRNRLDQRRLPRARRTVEEEAELVREAGDGELAALLLEVVEKVQQLLLVREEERLEGLLVGELVPLVEADGRPLVLIALDRRHVKHHEHVPLLVALLLEGAFVPRVRAVDVRVDALRRPLPRGAQRDRRALLAHLALLVAVAVFSRLPQLQAVADVDPRGERRHRRDLHVGQLGHAARALVVRVVVLLLLAARVFLLLLRRQLGQREHAVLLRRDALGVGAVLRRVHHQRLLQEVVLALRARRVAPRVDAPFEAHRPLDFAALREDRREASQLWRSLPQHGGEAAEEHGDRHGDEHVDDHVPRAQAADQPELSRQVVHRHCICH
mmetsp:Transcript_47619/g.117900  ORF Transcript_47619/g.117900 Transcript_47619/m.117900 type:complete len:526 (-) Transcript_47619:22-1599(-)